MPTWRKGLYRSFLTSNQRHCLSRPWITPGPARIFSTPGFSPRCYRCGKPFFHGHLLTCPATRFECFVRGKHGQYVQVCFSSATTPYRSSQRKSFPVASIDHAPIKRDQAKGSGRACLKTNLGNPSVGSSDNKSATTCDSTAGVCFSRTATKSSLMSVAVAETQRKSIHCRQTKSVRNRRRDSRRIKDYYDKLQNEDRPCNSIKRVSNISSYRFLHQPFFLLEPTTQCSTFQFLDIPETRTSLFRSERELSRCDF